MDTNVVAPTETAMTQNKITNRNQLLVDQVERLRQSLAKSEAEWSEILAVSLGEYRTFRRGLGNLSILALSNLAKFLDLNLENLMSGEIDYKVIAARNAGSDCYLPERYSQNGFSRRRTAANLLNAAEEFLGWQARVGALRYLQTSEASFQDLDETINLKFQTDLCDYLYRNYDCDNLFYSMGAYSLVSNYNSELGRSMSQHRDLQTLYQYFVEAVLVNHWENNYHYRLLKLTPTSCQIEAIANPDAASAVGVSNPGSCFICQTKAGVASCLPGYLGMPFAHVRESRCVHRGDSSCIQEVDFEIAASRIKQGYRAPSQTLN